MENAKPRHKRVVRLFVFPPFPCLAVRGGNGNFAARNKNDSFPYEAILHFVPRIDAARIVGGESFVAHGRAFPRDEPCDRQFLQSAARRRLHYRLGLRPFHHQPPRCHAPRGIRTPPRPTSHRRTRECVQSRCGREKFDDDALDFHPRRRVCGLGQTDGGHRFDGRYDVACASRLAVGARIVPGGLLCLAEHRHERGHSHGLGTRCHRCGLVFRSRPPLGGRRRGGRCVFRRQSFVHFRHHHRGHPLARRATQRQVPCQHPHRIARRGDLLRALLRVGPRRPQCGLDSQFQSLESRALPRRVGSRGARCRRDAGAAAGQCPHGRHRFGHRLL